MLSFILDRIENQNIRIGKLVANQKNAIINLYYTPTVLTTNSLIFDKKKYDTMVEKEAIYMQKTKTRKQTLLNLTSLSDYY